MLTQAEANGIITLHSRCYPSESSLAYTPLVATLRAIQQHPTLIQRLNQVSSNCLHETSRLLPDLTTPHAPLPTPHTPLTSPAAQTRFFEGITQLLQTTLAGTIWLLDDLHWADSATLDLLAYLRHHATTTPLLLLLTWRNEETAVSPHLHQIMTEAERSQTGQRLTLGRWSQQDVTAFVQSNAPNLAGTVDHRLFAESEGLPFFAAAYLDALAQQQDWTIPPTARDLLLSRLEAMPPMPQQLLQTAAAIGRSFPFDTLQQASGRSEEETITGLERLLAADLVRETAVSPPQFDFTHDKLRTLVYDETSFMRRRLLHSRIAHTIYSQQRTPAALAAAASQLAHHHQLAGNETEAANQFKLAGDHARSLFANREALTYYETALALGYGETAVLHEALGDLHTLLGRYEAAIGAYETAVSHLTPNENLAIAQLEHKLGLVHQRRGSWETAESHFLAAQTIASTPRLLADRSRNAHHRHQPDEALALAQQALTLAQQTNDSPTLAQVHNLLGTLARQQNDFAAAEAQFTHSLALAETLDDPTARIAALNNLGLVYGENGRFAAGITALQTALALCQTQGDRHRQAALHNNLADLHHAAGQHETAMHHLKQAATLYADISKLGTDWQPEIWKLTEW
ncbi:MAG: tetratricopeptide repeat protein [Ardenticatenaceae bacterium]|nr:tetratricopeptide repeat protein [Ardenticatenaceae bacterium]